MIPRTKAESMAILDEYRDRLTPEQYRNIERAIGHMAIEGMYLERDIIDRLVRVQTGVITQEEAKAEIFGTKVA